MLKNFYKLKKTKGHYTMTIKLFGYRIVIFKAEKIETFKACIDAEARQNDAEQIKNGDTFKAIKAQADAYRANRK